jgi:hypothetical protein
MRISKWLVEAKSKENTEVKSWIRMRVKDLTNVENFNKWKKKLEGIIRRLLITKGEGEVWIPGRFSDSWDHRKTAVWINFRIARMNKKKELFLVWEKETKEELDVGCFIFNKI